MPTTETKASEPDLFELMPLHALYALRTRASDVRSRLEALRGFTSARVWAWRVTAFICAVGCVGHGYYGLRHEVPLMAFVNGAGCLAWGLNCIFSNWRARYLWNDYKTDVAYIRGEVQKLTNAINKKVSNES
jgi:hypothetical protein